MAKIERFCRPTGDIHPVGLLSFGFSRPTESLFTPSQGSGKDSNSNTVQRCGVNPPAMARVRLRYRLGDCWPLRARGWDSFTLRISWYLT